MCGIDFFQGANGSRAAIVARHLAVPKCLRFEFVAGAEKQGSLDKIFEFANVARPCMQANGRHHSGVDRRDVTPHRAGINLKEVASQRLQVFPRLAKRRQPDFEHVQAVVEISSKPARRNFGFDFAIGGGNHSDVDRHRFIAADSVHLPILQYSQ